MNNRMRQTCRAFALARQQTRVYMWVRFPVQEYNGEPVDAVRVSSYVHSNEVPEWYKYGYRFSPRSERMYFQYDDRRYVH